MPPHEPSQSGRDAASQSPTRPKNRLLAALPAAEYEKLRPALEPVELRLRDMLQEADRPIDHVYFPDHGVLSTLNFTQEGHAVEVGTVGPEGFGGLPVLFGTESMPSTVFVQVPGAGSRMAAAAFRRALRDSEPFFALLLRYVQAFLHQVAQSSACNRLHSVEKRCARWLLMTQDRVDGEPMFPLTQEFLAQMLGVRRPTVSITAGMLQQAGLIRYARGRMRVLNRESLEAASCECYGSIRREYERVIGSNG
jgi:CRP-like cAMP-binding protein